jgi:hypothetical protein
MSNPIGASPDDQAGAGRGDEPETIRSFPTEAVVGVVSDAGELLRVREELEAAGLEAQIVAGDRGAERIRQAGGGNLSLRLTRTVQEMFGYEAEHTERHLKELEIGHLIVIVESRDDETTNRVRDILAAHGGHFTNYYSRWTSRVLLP